MTIIFHDFCVLPVLNEEILLSILWPIQSLLKIPKKDSDFKLKLTFGEKFSILSQIVKRAAQFKVCTLSACIKLNFFV